MDADLNTHATTNPDSPLILGHHLFIHLRSVYVAPAPFTVLICASA